MIRPTTGKRIPVDGQIVLEKEHDGNRQPDSRPRHYTAPRSECEGLEVSTKLVRTKLPQDENLLMGEGARYPPLLREKPEEFVPGENSTNLLWMQIPRNQTQVRQLRMNGTHHDSFLLCTILYFRV